MGILNSILKCLHLSDTKEKIVNNLFWAVIGKIVSLLSGLFVGIIIARYLGPENYGLLNYVISYVSLFQIFAYLGLDSIEIREEAKNSVPFQLVMGTAFVLKLISAFITILAVVATSLWFESSMETTLMVSIYSLSIVANVFTVQRNYFTSIVQNEYVVKSEIFRTVVGMTIKIILLLFHVDLLWFILASTFDYVLLAGGYIFSYHKKIGKMSEWNFSWPYAKFLLRESFPLLLTNAAVVIYQRIDQVMIGNILEKSSVGYFSVALKFVEILIFVPIILTQTITPVLVRFRKESEDNYERKAQQFMNITFWLSFLLSVLLSIFAYWVVIITFGEKYLQAVPILQILAFKTASSALSSTAGTMLVIERLQKYAILRDSLGCVVCILGNYYLLPRYGIIAAAFVSIASVLTAGYFADAIIPPFRHLFHRQCRTLFTGWRDLVNLVVLFRNRSK